MSKITLPHNWKTMPQSEWLNWLRANVWADNLALTGGFSSRSKPQLWSCMLCNIATHHSTIAKCIRHMNSKKHRMQYVLWKLAK